MIKLNQSNNNELITNFGLSYLRLFLLINLIDSNSIPKQIKEKTISIGTKENNHSQSSSDDHFFNWKLINDQNFINLFNGDVFISALTSGMVKNDPSLALVENCFILRSIAIEMNSPIVAVSCVREILSVLFFCLKCPSGYWYLSLSAHTSLLTGAVIPLAHHFANSETSRETREITLSILSCLLYQRWPTPQLISPPADFALYQTYPSQYPNAPNDIQQLFYEKIRGLIIQFCSTASPILSLHIMNVIPIPDFYSSPDIPHLSGTTWVDLIEVTLRNYVITSNDHDVLLLPCKSLTISIPDRFNIIDCSVVSTSGLTLLVLLYQWKNEFQEQHPIPPSNSTTSSGNNSEISSITPWPSTEMFSKALSFVPARYRSYDRLLIWFFILELVQSPRFHPVHAQNDVCILFLFVLFFIFFNPSFFFF